MRLALVYLLVLGLTAGGDASSPAPAKREIADPPFWANRGRRTSCLSRLCSAESWGADEGCGRQRACLQRLVRQDDLGPFWANRGKRDPPFWANRGRRDPPFWANRGKRDVQMRDFQTPLLQTIHEPLYVEEPRWILVRRDEKQPPPHAASEYDPFFVTRGKKKAAQQRGFDFEGDYDEPAVAGHHMRDRREDDAPFFAARGKKNGPEYSAASPRSGPAAIYGRVLQSAE